MLMNIHTMLEMTVAL